MPNDKEISQASLAAPQRAVEAGGSSAQGASEFGSRLTFIIHEHQYLLDTIKFSDQKAAFVFAFAAGVMALGYNLKLYERISGRVLDWAWGNGFSALALALILISACMSLATLLPRLWSHQGHGLVYFQHVLLHKSHTAYAAAIVATKDIELLSDLSAHCYTLGAIAQRKFVYTKWALWAGGLGGLLTMLAVAGLASGSHATNAQQALESVDHAAAAVIATFDLELPLPEVSQRAALLGAELRSVNTANLTTRQRELLEAFRNGYATTIRLTKMLTGTTVLNPVNPRPHSPVGKGQLGMPQPEEKVTPEGVTKLRQEATKLLESAHTSLVNSRTE